MILGHLASLIPFVIAGIVLSAWLNLSLIEVVGVSVLLLFASAVSDGIEEAATRG